MSDMSDFMNSNDIPDIYNFWAIGMSVEDLSKFYDTSIEQIMNIISSCLSPEND